MDFYYIALQTEDRNFVARNSRIFLKRNGIFHTFSPPYHPATNGAAGNFIQTFKAKVSKIEKEGETVENAVNMFLYDYRNFPHYTTGRSPANLVYNRNLRTRFDQLKPSVLETVESSPAS